MSEGGFEICSVGGADEVNDLELRARADREWRVWTRGFVARRDGREAGLLMLDFYDRTFTAKVHELFVLRHSRGSGVAKLLMMRAEAAALESAASSMELEAHPLDEWTNLSRLRCWYSSMGFNGNADSRLMTKSLSSRDNG